jgi:alanyl-tRNA synthetase
MVRMFKCGRSFSNHIEKKKSKCDYHFDRNLTEAEIEKLNNKVNEVIGMNIDVEEEFVTRNEAEKKFNLTKLPESAGEKIRVIKIGDYDACPCSGLHVSNTNEISKFQITTASFEDGVLRLRFKLYND